jgi:hypothetical protein
MTRMLAFIAALLLTAITVSSACVASISMPLHFTIEPRSGDQVHVRFNRERNGHSESNWETSFRPGELAGLDVAALNSPGTRPLRFAIVREAGRVDCSGSGGNQMARGICSMTSNPDFERFLGERGVGKPSDEQSFGLIALNVHRDLVDALANARYPTPSIEKLIELTAVDVTPAYIDQLSRQGYRPQSLQSLVEFAALKITPEYIGSFARAGYPNLPPDQLVQLKAMNVTPEFVRAVQQGDTLPSPDHLVQIRAVSEDIRKR